jgi:Ca2+-binding EF-hand superfamily protein
MKADNKFTKFSSLLTPKNLVFNCYNSGYISLKEIRKVAKDLGELTDDNILQEMIEIADRDLDTVVSEEEFYNLLTKKVY